MTERAHWTSLALRAKDTSISPALSMVSMMDLNALYPIDLSAIGWGSNRIIRPRSILDLVSKTPRGALPPSGRRLNNRGCWIKRHCSARIHSWKLKHWLTLSLLFEIADYLDPSEPNSVTCRSQLFHPRFDKSSCITRIYENLIEVWCLLKSRPI